MPYVLRHTLLERRQGIMKHGKQLAAALLTLLLVLTAGCERPGPQAAPNQPAVREITDMAGRTVTVPAETGMVFPVDPAAAVYLYTLAPDKLLGWNYALNEIEKSVILEKYHNLPNFGMGDAVNYEAVIAAGPSAALYMGTINGALAGACDRMAESLGIPVLAVDGSLTNAPEAYRFMGRLLGEEEQAERLAVYAEKVFADMADMDIPEGKKVRLYCGNGEDSLETVPAGSSHGQLFDLVNAVNVAELELGEGTRIQISPEQLLAWDPDIIVTLGEARANISGQAAAAEILKNPDYAALKAVQNRAVYGVPNAPFSWVDRPPASNRLAGVRWLSGLLYPQYLNFDADEEIREFFSLFYHVDLTDEQLQALYDGSWSPL